MLLLLLATLLFLLPLFLLPLLRSKLDPILKARRTPPPFVTTIMAAPKSDVKLPEEVVTHPLVLLSIVDHYNRVARDTSKRVVGVLLGSTFQGKCDVTNSFAVPFDEDLRNPGIWYLDHDFLESMYHMFKKINGASYDIDNE